MERWIERWDRHRWKGMPERCTDREVGYRDGRTDRRDRRQGGTKGQTNKETGRKDGWMDACLETDRWRQMKRRVGRWMERQNRDWWRGMIERLTEKWVDEVAGRGGYMD